jgi:hypothetical protein
LSANNTPPKSRNNDTAILLKGYESDEKRVYYKIYCDILRSISLTTEFSAYVEAQRKSNHLRFGIWAKARQQVVSYPPA